MARTSLSRDSLDHERRGRVVGDNHHREAIRARMRELLRIRGRSSGVGGRPAGAPMSAPAASGVRAPSNEAVLKVISWTKARHAPLAQAKYAARTREQDPPEASLTMINEEGRELHGAEVEAEIRSWDLKPNSENLSPAARRAGLEERAAMSDGERLQRRQAVHLIFSIPAHPRADVDWLDRAVRGALSETLGEGGFRYVYTTHTDHSSRPHAHIIAKAQSEPFTTATGEMKTRQLRLGPRELEATRQVFTRHAQEQDLNVIASRREDRAGLRQEILAGRAPLRANKKLHQVTGQMRQGRTFERQAPQWYSEHGLEYERRRLAAAGSEPVAASPVENASPKRAGGLLGRFMDRLGVRQRRTPNARGPENAPSVGQPSAGYFQNFENYRKGAEASEARVNAHFAATHHDPARAAESFRAMLREAPRLAVMGREQAPDLLWRADRRPRSWADLEQFTGG